MQQFGTNPPFSHSRFSHFSTASPPFPNVPSMNFAGRTSRLEKRSISDEPTQAELMANTVPCLYHGLLSIQNAVVTAVYCVRGHQLHPKYVRRPVHGVVGDVHLHLLPALQGHRHPHGDAAKHHQPEAPVHKAGGDLRGGQGSGSGWVMGMGVSWGGASCEGWGHCCGIFGEE